MSTEIESQDDNRVRIVMAKEYAALKQQLEAANREIAELQARLDSSERLWRDLRLTTFTREQVMPLVEALKHWIAYNQTDTPKTHDQQEAVGEDFTNVWYETENALSHARSVGLLKE